MEETGGLVICRPQPIRAQYGDEVGLTLQSDIHLGAANVMLDKVKAEWECARDNGDRILINGDLWDMILVKDVKRYTPVALHPRLSRRNNIVDAAIDWAFELLKPYADLIDMIGVGNHETAVEKYHNIDPTKILVYRLQQEIPKKSPHIVHYGGYTGFMDYRLRRINRANSTRPCEVGWRLVVYYHHGFGGSAPVSKGMIDFSRLAWAEADILWIGHKHNRFNGHVQHLGCPVAGDEPKEREIRHIMTGSYFKTYGGQSQQSLMENGRRSNYAADGGKQPQGRGGTRVLIRMGMSDKPLEMKVIQ